MSECSDKSECNGVLLDTVAIQDYVFRSNKLRENVGASYLVDNIFDSVLQKALEFATGINAAEINLTRWRTSDADAPMLTNDRPYDIGYIGGGNALLFFLTPKQAQKFIRHWTRLLLVHTPGLHTAVALTENFPPAPEKFQESMEKLSRRLEKNKQYYQPTVLLPRHGITAECARSGLSAELFNKTVGDYVSSTTNAAIKAAKISNDALQKKYLQDKEEKIRFPVELEELGGTPGEDNHIAIVHIDGNGMGHFFKEVENLRNLRKLSIKIDEAIKNAFAELISTITEPEYVRQISKELGKPAAGTEKEKEKILPIRPIILGGDDLTFVCDGKFGLYFARMIIKHFEQNKIDGRKLTACAGVAVIKTKYPFYRGYLLAESLCANAKKEAVRQQPDSPPSVIDFQICLGSIDGDLQQVRANGYTNNSVGNTPNLLFRPYSLFTGNQLVKKDFDKILQDTARFSSWPGTKLNELREALYQPKAQRRHFVNKLKYRELTLPKTAGGAFAGHLFNDRSTPYFDMLEIYRFYPQFALKEIRKQNNADT